jgi:hypothetical protein
MTPIMVLYNYATKVGGWVGGWAGGRWLLHRPRGALPPPLDTPLLWTSSRVQPGPPGQRCGQPPRLGPALFPSHFSPPPAPPRRRCTGSCRSRRLQRGSTGRFG